MKLSMAQQRLDESSHSPNAATLRCGELISSFSGNTSYCSVLVLYSTRAHSLHSQCLAAGGKHTHSASHLQSTL
jgi:hypothetical protein